MEENNEELKAKQIKWLKELESIEGVNGSKSNDNITIKEMVERFQKYIQTFEEEFKTNEDERLKKAPLLVRLYRDNMNIMYAPSKRYNLAIDSIDKINKELNVTLTSKQRLLLEQKKSCESIIIDDLIEIAFVYGYSMYDELSKETEKTQTNKLK